MADDFQDKTEEASSKKLSDARKKGQVSKSQDLTSSFLLITALCVLFLFSSFMFNEFVKLIRLSFDNIKFEIGSIEFVTLWARAFLKGMALMLVPYFIFLFIAAVLINIVQVGFEISFDPLVPKWKKVNIFDPSNYKKFFDLGALMKLLFGLGKMAIVMGISSWIIWSVTDQISGLIYGEISDIFVFILKNSFYIGLVSGIILFILAILDMIYQKWKFKQDMKMSKQDVKDERRQVEGDVQTRSRMRAMMQGMIQTSMKDQIPKADVVIANPVHYAVALKYDSEKMGAPVCVGKGMRKMALYIRELAEEAGVPIVENPPLARMLHKSVEVGAFVPPDLYQAVAEVLAYIYRLSEKSEQKG